MLYESSLGAVVAGVVRSMIGLGTVMVTSDALLARRGGLGCWKVAARGSNEFGNNLQTM